MGIVKRYATENYVGETIADSDFIRTINGEFPNGDGNIEIAVPNRDEIIEEICEALPNNQVLIDNITEQVPIVKVAAPPEFVNNITECVDISKIYVLPNGHLCCYMTSEIVTEGSTVANFTNIYNEAKGAYIKNGQRYSHSSAAFKEQASDCSIVVPLSPFTINTEITLRVRGATTSGASYGDSNYWYFGTTNQTFDSKTAFDRSITTDANGDIILKFKLSDSALKYMVFCVAAGVDDGNLIITQDEEITYTVTEGGTTTKTEWTDTGIAYNQPPDYTSRVIAVETKTAQIENDVDALENVVKSMNVNSNGENVFSIPAYPPYPQLAGDGSDGTDFNIRHIPTADAYAYMDALANKYKTYVVKQNLGKDTSGDFDYYRYVFSKAYWRAWHKKNYPKMYSWINGSTVIYSVSVSPRVGDAMYSTPYIGTVYNTVTAVNCSTAGVASTRTVNGLVFTRNGAGDVEPTIVYTKPMSFAENSGYIWDSGFNFYKSIKTFTREYIIDSADVTYYRYPFEDKKLDKSRPLSVFVLANEHGNNGDSLMPSVTVMRMAKDLCQNTENHFLKWMKENVILTLIPVGNPWGYNRNPATNEKGYYNANGVNINRNYDTPGWAGSDHNYGDATTFGAYAGSENENQYIMNTIQQCKADVGMSFHGISYVADKHGISEYNGNAVWEGCGFEQSGMWKVSEALFSQYNFGFSPNTGNVVDDSDNNYNNCGKSQAYIQYTGAVGGLVETIDWEIGTANNYTAVAMEQAYAELLLVLQNWIEEALNK